MSIVKLGTSRLLPGEVDADLVDAIKDLLERAEKGEITALAWAGVTGNQNLITGWEGSGGTMFDLSAAVSCLAHRYTAFCLEGKE